MGLVKLITGKTLVRHIWGEPGTLKEFFEMVHERGESAVQAQLILEDVDTQGHAAANSDESRIEYSVGDLKYVEYLVHPDDLPRIAPHVQPHRDDIFGDYLSGKKILEVLRCQLRLHAPLYEGVALYVVAPTDAFTQSHPPLFSLNYLR